MGSPGPGRMRRSVESYIFGLEFLWDRRKGEKTGGLSGQLFQYAGGHVLHAGGMIVDFSIR
jgi:hypothetical protein